MFLRLINRKQMGGCPSGEGGMGDGWNGWRGKNNKIKP